jgi:type IV secretory pathway TraG/TraD family ATPase VirD4
VSGYEDNAFERALRKELLRGVKGEPEGLQENSWAVAEELGPEWSYGPDHKGLLLGYRRLRPVGWNDNRHLLTVATTRAGKGASLIIPTCCSMLARCWQSTPRASWPGSQGAGAPI